VICFKLELGRGAEKRLYPTVYTLWHNPNLVPLLYTPGFVMGKLQGGADLMTPGLANEPPFPAKAITNAVVAVAGVDRHTVPRFVGICEIDVSALGDVQGTKGSAVRGLHWEGDELWAWSSSSRPGRAAPEYLEGWDEDESEELEEGVEALTVEETGGAEETEETPRDEPASAEEAKAEEPEPTTKGEPTLHIDMSFIGTNGQQKLMTLSSMPLFTLSTSSNRTIHPPIIMAFHFQSHLQL
jgi:translation initiation factor 2D